VVVSANENPFSGGFFVTPSRLARMLESRNFIDSDIDLMLTLFSLIDKRGYKLLDIRDVFISFLVVVSKSVKECVLSALRMYDRENSTVIEKDTMVHVMSLLNNACTYFGDRGLLQAQVVDLVDSLFTMAGKVDGYISYIDYQDIISQHPIVEMLLSHQYQGPVRDKILDEEKIELLDIQL
jgi:Ca2+-binding EF-hand superfamily protein